MATIKELFAQGAKQISQEVWTEQEEDVPEADRAPGREYHFRLTITRADDKYRVYSTYLGYRVKDKP